MGGWVVDDLLPLRGSGGHLAGGGGPKAHRKTANHATNDTALHSVAWRCVSVGSVEVHIRRSLPEDRPGEPKAIAPWGPEVATTKFMINLIVGWLEARARVGAMWVLRFCPWTRKRPTQNL